METEPDAAKSADATKTVEESTRKAAGLAMPTLVPRRLFHQHGPVTRRKVLAAATSGIAGVILGERLLRPLRAEAQAARPAALAVRRRHAVRAQYRRRRRRRNRRHGRSQQDATAGLRRARRLSLADAHQAGRRGAGARPRQPARRWPGSNTGTTATAARSRTISRRFPPPTRAKASSSSTRPRAARTC